MRVAAGASAHRHAIPFLPGLSPVAARSPTATFDAGRLSSDGGLIVLREIASRLGLCASSSPALEGRGKALYEKSSGRENLLEERLDAVPAWLAVTGKPASCT